MDELGSSEPHKQQHVNCSEPRLLDCDQCRLRLSSKKKPESLPVSRARVPRAHKSHIFQKPSPATVEKLKKLGDIFSIRGVQKIFRAETPFIRFIWILFVVSMTFLLTSTSFFLIIDYLSYTKAWQTRTLIDDKTEFPAITLCAHNPFSLKANSIWKSDQILSPKQFKSDLARLSIEMLDRNQPEYAANLLFSDSIEYYYTNLKRQEAFSVGHKSEMFPHCMLHFEDSVVVAEKCELETETSMQRKAFSHPKYFNCWTIEGKSEANTSDITRLIILVNLVPSKQIVEANTSFIMDTFTRGEGIKLVVHQRGTYPEIDKHGINVQPNRMNEITYETLRWNRLSTPVDPCNNAQDAIEDMGEFYVYRQSQCLDRMLQTITIQRCGCLHSEWPRPKNMTTANDSIPYCTAIHRGANDENTTLDLIKRFSCVSSVLMEIKGLKEKALRRGECIPRCSHFTYDTKLSVTAWDPSPTKLAMYTKYYRSVDGFLQHLHNTSYKDKLVDDLQKLILHNSSPRFAETYHITTDYTQFREGTYTYVSLIRQEFQTTLKEERLVFDVAILLSRIGGLCSLCIGLTMAFFVEIIEFVYLLFHRNTSEKSNASEVNGSNIARQQDEMCTSLNYLGPETGTLSVG